MLVARLAMLCGTATAAVVAPTPGAYSGRGSTVFSGRGFFVSAAFVGNAGWDPLNLASEANLVALRNAEVKHGRLAMLAAVGWPAQELIHPLLVDALRGLKPHDVLRAGGLSPSLFAGGLEQPEVAPALAFTLVVGSLFEIREIQLRTAKGLAINEWAPDSVAGDVSFDPMKIATDLTVTDRFELQQAEIINGRLAMLMCLAYAAVEGLLGVPVVSLAP